MSETKQAIIQQVIDQLQHDLEILRNAALETHLNSTSDQAKQEGKYDTRGLEASYLAGAQAAKVIQLETDISKLGQTSSEEVDFDTPIGPGCMVITTVEDHDHPFIVLPAGGGLSFPSQGLEFTVVTPESPIGSALLGKSVGDSFLHPQLGEALIADLW